MNSIHDDVLETLYSEDELKAMVSRVASEIQRDYEGKNLFMVAVLKGSLMFMADLMRQLDLYCAIDFMVVSSYGSGTSTSGEVRVLKDIGCPLEGKDVLIVEDILDSGVTLAYLKKMLSARNPNSIKIATLLDKPERRRTDVEADYKGSVVPDKFIVGYGLDYNEEYRNLPYIGVLKPDVYSK